MKKSMDEKRLFFGFEVHAPWTDTLPDARTLKGESSPLENTVKRAKSSPKK